MVGLQNKNVVWINEGTKKNKKSQKGKQKYWKDGAHDDTYKQTLSMERRRIYWSYKVQLTSTGVSS